MSTNPTEKPRNETPRQLIARQANAIFECIAGDAIAAVRASGHRNRADRITALAEMLADHVSGVLCGHDKSSPWSDELNEAERGVANVYWDRVDLRWHLALMRDCVRRYI